MKGTISIIAGICVGVCVLIHIFIGIPDTFKYGGVYFDKYPRWMDIVFVFGAVFISMLAGFVSGSIVYCILDSKQIRLWGIDRLRRYRDRSIYKFN